MYEVVRKYYLVGLNVVTLIFGVINNCAWAIYMGEIDEPIYVSNLLWARGYTSVYSIIQISVIISIFCIGVLAFENKRKNSNVIKCIIALHGLFLCAWAFENWLKYYLF